MNFNLIDKLKKHLEHNEKASCEDIDRDPEWVEAISEEIKCQIPTFQSELNESEKMKFSNINPDNEQSENKAQFLMTLIGNAIEEWALYYHLDNLPKDILFKQAVALINETYKMMDL